MTPRAVMVAINMRRSRQREGNMSRDWDAECRWLAVNRSDLVVVE